jgi:hypothetical protein
LSNGLSKSEEKMLTKCKAQLDAILEKRFLMGRGEATEIAGVSLLIASRLSPPLPAVLKKQAAALVAKYGGLDWVKQQLEKVGAEEE